MRTFVDSLVTEKLAEYFEEHPSVARAILEKAMQACRAREAAKGTGAEPQRPARRRVAARTVVGLSGKTP